MGKRLIACGLSGLLTGSLAATEAAGALELPAGGYTFSDELGGFRIVSASGAGTSADPVILVEEIQDAVPITLVIRRRPDIQQSRPSFAPLTIVKVVINRSRLVWAGFEVELQERLKQPSTYGDGLSFNQFGAKPPDVNSDAFADTDRLYEPYDRIRFENGYVDPDATARFKLTITDPTPIPQFYLVQDPKLLSAALPQRRSLALAP